MGAAMGTTMGPAPNAPYGAQPPHTIYQHPGGAFQLPPGAVLLPPDFVCVMPGHMQGHSNAMTAFIPAQYGVPPSAQGPPHDPGVAPYGVPPPGVAPYGGAPPPPGVSQVISEALSVLNACSSRPVSDREGPYM